ncbi:helix-turn-helix domain-containing protein [Nocardiopsis sp. CT-R113]|uniref:Helix-turn-helix domain-containing protein n=1 Tax=Nocardiopsis codii TaxID=3065942 RepID=A0ABU7K6X0_9ACTN|nr:helix-turn-helix domain-containing protein [Nocardiopsis sp. CT-R113]MEE2037986.1 helix-turn-helix domain-containing protein [Nocardiopsis sp. CT-R113]
MGHEQRARVSAGLVRDRAGLVERIVAEVYAEVPAYRALHGSQLAEVRAITGWLVSRSLELWVAGETRLPPEDVERLRGIGRSRAADGRSIGAVVRAHRVGSVAAVRVVCEYAAGKLDAADVFALSELWLTSIDQISESLSVGHAETAHRLDADRERARRAFLDDLLIGRQASRGAIRDRARTLGIAPPDPAVLVVAETEGTPADGSPRADTVSAGMGLLGLVEPAGADPLLTTRSGRVVLLASPDDAGRVAAVLGAHPWRGCVLAPRALADMSAAYRLADDAMETAPPHAFDPEGLLREADACVLALLNGGPVTPASVRRTVLGPLLSADHAHLLETLRAYFREGAATTAADALHVHAQTLRYRLRRVRELTGHDPHRPWPRFVLETACAIAP